jgi:tetratricopeptide (TPR) repeat protein
MYDKAISIDPKYADALMNLGSTYGTLQKYDKAIEYFLKSDQYNPGNPEVYNFLSMTYKFMGDNANAEIYSHKKEKAKQLKKKK